MSTMRVNVEPLAVDATCTDEALRVVLADGREITVPLAWFHHPIVRELNQPRKS